MTEICNDNRFELIEKYKNKLLENTNIADSKEEMDVIDNILFRFWQMGWFDKLEQFDYQKEEIKNLNAWRYRMIDIKAYEGLTTEQQLTLFRNMYYNDRNATEKRIIANAINDILPEYNRQKAEIERLHAEEIS